MAATFATHAYGYQVRSAASKPIVVSFREPLDLDEARRQLTPRHLSGVVEGRKVTDVKIYTDAHHTRYVGL